MARAMAVLLLVFGALALGAACNDESDFLLDEGEREATGTPPFEQRTPQPTPEPSPEGSPPAAEGTPGVCGETYVVESGDYPFKIAEKCGVDPGEVAAWADELLELNGIDDPTTLRVGQELKLPQSTEVEE